MSDPQVPISAPALLAKRPKYKPILITLLCAVLLGGGTCYGFVSTLNLNRSNLAATVFAIIFVASVVVFIAGVIWLLVTLARNATRNN